MILDDRPQRGRNVNLLVSTAVIAMISGLTVILCWIFNLSPLKEVFPAYIPMKFNTAFCFMLSGVALLMQVTYRRTKVQYTFRLITIGFGTLALLSLSQNVFNWSAGVDQLLVIDTDTPAKGLPFPGRMSPSSAFCFSLLAIGFLGVDSKNRASKLAGQYSLHIVTVIAFIGIVGYLLRIPYALKFSFFSLMGFNTALGLFLLSAAGSLINHTLGLTSLFTGLQVGDYSARKLFPRLIFILIVISYIKLDLQRNNLITSEFGVVISATTYVLLTLFLIKDTLTEMNVLDIKRIQAEYQTQLVQANIDAIVEKRIHDIENQKARLTGVLDASPVGVLLIDSASSKCTEINDTLLKWLAYDKAEVLGRDFSDLFMKGINDQQNLLASVTGGQPIKQLPFVLTNKHGMSKPALLSAELLTLGTDKYIAIFVSPVTAVN